LAAHLFDSGIPLGGNSKRMPRNFLLLRSAPAVLEDLRFEFFQGAFDLRLGLGAFRISLQLGPTIEQGRTDPKIGRNLGRAAATGLTEL